MMKLNLGRSRVDLVKIKHLENVPILCYCCTPLSMRFQKQIWVFNKVRKFFSKHWSMEPTIFILHQQSAFHIKAMIFRFHFIPWWGHWGHYFGLSRLPKLGKTSSLSHGFWNAAAWYCWPILSLWVDTVGCQLFT